MDEAVRIHPRDPRRLSARPYSATGVMDDGASYGCQGLYSREAQPVPQCDVVSTSFGSSVTQRAAYEQPYHSSLFGDHCRGSGHYGSQWEMDSPEHVRAAERSRLFTSPDTTNSIDSFDLRISQIRGKTNAADQPSAFPEQCQGSVQRNVQQKSTSPPRKHRSHSPERDWNSDATRREVRHECFRCGQRFETRQALKQHVKSERHYVSKSKNPRCLLCHKVFPNWSILEKHIKDKGHAYSRGRSRSRSQKRKSRSPIDDEQRSPKRMVSRVVTYNRNRSPRRSHSSSSSPRESSRSRERSPFERDHVRLVKYRNEEPPTPPSSTRQKSPEVVVLIPLEASEGRKLIDPRTLTKKKIRFVPKKIPVTQSRVSVFNCYFPIHSSLPWNLTSVDGARILTERNMDGATIQSDNTGEIRGFCTKEEIDAAIQRIARSIAQQTLPEHPTPREKISRDLVMADVKETETLPRSDSAYLAPERRCEESAAGLLQPGKPEVIQSDAVNEESRSCPDMELAHDTAESNDEATRGKIRVSTSAPVSVTKSEADQMVPVTSDTVLVRQLDDDVEVKLAKLFSDEVAKDASTALLDETTCYMYFVPKAIDLCPECQFDLNSSPLVTVNVVTGDVMIDCTDCGTQTVMEGVYTLATGTT